MKTKHDWTLITIFLIILIVSTVGIIFEHQANAQGGEQEVRAFFSQMSRATDRQARSLEDIASSLREISRKLK